MIAIIELCNDSETKCSKTIKRIADLISARKNEQYSQVMNFLRTRLRFSLLKSVLIAVRGIRGKVSREISLGHIVFNMIPIAKSYDV